MLDVRRPIGSLLFLIVVIALGGVPEVLAATAAADAAANASPERWLDRYRRLAEAAPADCPPATIPSLTRGIQAKAFPLTDLSPESGAGGRVVYSEDSIAERLIVLAEDARGCIHAGDSGRLRPFDARSLASHFPNTVIPDAIGATTPVAIVADTKAVLPWVRVMGTSDFDALSARLWVLFGGYTGMLTVLLLVGIGFAVWQRSRLAFAYVLYIGALQFYQLDFFGVGFAWLPFWPGPEHARLLHVLSLALVVPGLAVITVEFLKPAGWKRLAVLGAFALSTLAFALSYWYAAAYRLGPPFLLIALALVSVPLVERLRSGEPAMRWFAAGFVAIPIAVASQAFAVIAGGAGTSGASELMIPIGSLVESIFWLIAIASQLRTERAFMLKQLEHDATHDPLTGIYNRAHLRAEIQAALDSVRRDPKRRCGVLFLDLDGFKRINDTLGHAMGDRVLEAVALALQGLALGNHKLGRFGGDEFVVLIEEPSHWSVVMGAATALVERFKEPLSVAGQSVGVRASVGLVSICAAHRDVDQIVADADLALYVAKREGGGRVQLFEPAMREQAQHQAERRLALPDALTQDRILVHYQPIFELGCRRPVGLEALVRWDHPREGLLEPKQFLVLAEETGLAVAIGGRVIEKVLAQIQDWQEAGLWRDGDFVSINVCGPQLTDDRIVEQLTHALRRWTVDPVSVRLEFAEALLAERLACARRVLPRLSGYNLLSGVDRFGTGVSALTMVSDLDLSLIKIDASLIKGITRLVRSQNLARGILALGQEMGCQVIAEGIETEEQLALLQTLGCRYGQGVKLASPMPGDEATAWLALPSSSSPVVHESSGSPNWLH